MGKSSEGELRAAAGDCRPCGRAGAGQQCPLHGQTEHIPQPEVAVPRQTQQSSCRWTWSSTAAGALGRLVKLSHHGSEASSEPVPLPMSKDSSRHSTHPTQCCSAHRAERGRAWGSQGAHQLCVTLPSWHRRDNLHSRFTSSLWASLVLSLLGSSTSCPFTHQDTPSITHPVRAGFRPPLSCSWAQHPPNIPTASNQSVSLLPSWHSPCLPGCEATSSAEP